jgi:hypothetical protein
VILEYSHNDNNVAQAGKRESDEWRSLGKQFGKFHGLSSLMNLAAICGGFAHLWFLAVALK